MKNCLFGFQSWKLKKKKCNSSSKRSVYYICLSPCKALLLVKGWQLAEMEVVGIPNEPSAPPRSSSAGGRRVCLLQQICINKRGPLGKARLLEEKNIVSQAYGSAQEFEVIVWSLPITSRFLSSSAVTMCTPEAKKASINVEAYHGRDCVHANRWIFKVLSSGWHWKVNWNTCV